MVYLSACCLITKAIRWRIPPLAQAQLSLGLSMRFDPKQHRLTTTKCITDQETHRNGYLTQEQRVVEARKVRRDAIVGG